MSRPEHGPIAVDLTTLPPETAEVARVFVTNGAGSTVFIDANVLSEPGWFGYLLADTARHAAKAYAQAWQLDESETLQAIVDGLSEELRAQVNRVDPVNEGLN
jgi:hypothetical protein